MNEVVIYKAQDKQIEVQVELRDDSVWLTQKQIASVFGTEVPAINKHIQNILNSNELSKSSTISKMEIVQKEGKREIKRTVDTYNLDMIISVGYRVNSQRATQFRIWANKIIKEHLVTGYSINKKRLAQLQQTVKLISAPGKGANITLDEAKGLLEIINNYTDSFITLNRYDSDTLETKNVSKKITYEISYEAAYAAINQLKKTLMGKKEAIALKLRERSRLTTTVLLPWRCLLLKATLQIRISW